MNITTLLLQIVITLFRRYKVLQYRAPEKIKFFKERKKKNMLILQWRRHNSPCMQRGQSFFGVKTLSNTLFPQKSAKPQNVIKMCVTTEDSGKKLEKTISARWLHKVPKALEARCLKHICGFGFTFPRTHFIFD